MNIFFLVFHLNIFYNLLNLYCIINKLQLKLLQIFNYMKYIILYKINAKLALQYIKIILKLSIIYLLFIYQIYLK